MRAEMGTETKCVTYFWKNNNEIRYKSKEYSLVGILSILLCSLSHTASAQSAAPGSTVVLDEVVVTANPSDEIDLIRKFQVLPGGVNLISRNEYPDTANLTLSRALADSPGVVVQNFFGGNDQPRIQIRGSGLQQNPVERGVLMLQNGLPLNRADGSYIVGFANPRQASSIETYRGYMANRIGATVLGGALNFVSPTGSGSPGIEVTASGGSFGQYGVSGQAGFARDNYDALLQFDVSNRDGFRDYNGSRSVNVAGNVGVQLTENIKTRLFIGYSELSFDVAGPISKTQLNTYPARVSRGPQVTPLGVVNPGPNVLRDQPQRDASQFLIGSRTTAKFDDHLFDLALGYTYTDDTFRFPITSGVRASKGGDFTGLVRYAYNPDEARPLPLFEMAAQYSIGSVTRKHYLNMSGATGALFGDNDLDATTLSLYAGLNIPILDSWTLSPAISYAYATRDNDDKYTSSTRPTIAYNPANPTMLLKNGAVATKDTGYSRSYNGWSPSLGLSYRLNQDQTVFAAVSHSFEPPTHDDLFAAVNGTPNSSSGRPNPANPMATAAVFATPDLEAQTATTIEGGWRGRTDNFSWDATVYYSWVNDELLSLRDVTGASLGAVNADKTRHFGIELGVGARLTDEISGRLTYTFQDFRFRNDELRGDNLLAGAPRHLVNATLQWQATPNWKLQGTVRWSPAKTPIDNMNTLYADSYVVADFRTEYKIDEHFTIFGEVTNVFDEKYAASTLVVDQATADQAAFLPGDGRGFYAGVKAKF